MDFYRKMWCVDCEAFIADVDILTHLAANPDHGLIRIDHNAVGNPTNGPGLSIPFTGSVYVDGGRTDTYTPDGSISKPYKTIQAGVNNCPVGGVVKVARWTYDENVVMPASKYLDADLGSILTTDSGDTLTIDDSGPPPVTTSPSFIRGLQVKCRDASGWCVHLIGTGAWPSNDVFAAFLDNILASENGAGCVWCEGAGCYLTDAGGTDGDPSICIRVGSPSSDVGGQVITGRFNLGCKAGGTVFDIHENAYVLADEASCNADGAGGVVARLNGLDTPGTYLFFSARKITTDSDWLSYVVSTGGNPIVRIDNNYSEFGGHFSGDVFDMPDGGVLAISDASYETDLGRVVRMGRNTPSPSYGMLKLKDVEGVSRNVSGYAVELEGGFGNATLYDCKFKNQSGGGTGVLKADISGGNALFLTDGSYEGLGPVVDLLGGVAFLLGGVDLISTGGGLPGSVPLAVAAGATVYRGHCNFRSGTPIVAGSEVLLNSTFGTLQLGPSVAQMKQSAGPALPGGGEGYTRGSTFVVIPLPSGTPALYLNTGTESVPVWVPINAAGIANYDRVQMQTCGSINLNGFTEAAPAVMPFAATPIIDGAYTFLGGGVVRVDHADVYRLSYNLSFEQVTSILLDGDSVGACWQYSTDSGSTWNDYIETKSFDTIHGVLDDHGSLTLPPVELEIAGGTWLRVVGFTVGSGGDCYINGNSPVLDWSWARIERGWVEYGYTPGNSSDWDLPIPTTISGAIDRLAEKLAIPPFVSGIGDPRVVPVIGYAGQIYKDTAAGIYYVCEADGTSTWGVL